MKTIIRLLVALAVVAGTLATAGAAHADVRRPTTAGCTTQTTTVHKDGVWYTTWAQYCEGLAKPVCLLTFRTVPIGRWPYRVTSLLPGGYRQCPVADIASARARF